MIFEPRWWPPDAHNSKNKKISHFSIAFLKREDKSIYTVKISISHHTYCVFYKKINLDASGGRLRKKCDFRSGSLTIIYNI